MLLFNKIFSIKNLIFFCLDKWVLQSCEVQSNSRLRIHICFSVGYTMKLIKGTVIHFYFKHLEFKWKCFCLKISCFNKKKLSFKQMFEKIYFLSINLLFRSRNVKIEHLLYLCGLKVWKIYGKWKNLLDFLWLD